MGCLYRITSPSGKCYIGITKGCAHGRFITHVYNALKDEYKTPLHASIRKYGKAAMHVETLVVADGRDYLCELEKKAIAAYSTRWPQGYNVTSGGEGVSEWSTEMRDAVGAKARGRKMSLETRRKMSTSHLGNTLSDQHRANISKGQVGKKLSDETRRNISRAKLGRSIVQPKDDASRKRRSDAVKQSWIARKLQKHTEDNHGN